MSGHVTKDDSWHVKPSKAQRHRDDALAALGLHVGHLGHDTEPVGFNPFRRTRRSPADYVIVAAALVVCAALVIWALAG